MDGALTESWTFTGWIAAGLLAGAWLLSRWWAAWRRSLRARRRGRRAADGEIDAERLLRQSGYRVLARQQAITWQLESDGDEIEVELRADLLVERDGRSFVAEVKTGDQAPSISTAATRRQLLEYLVAYETDSVLLVDVEREEIREVGFPL